MVGENGYHLKKNFFPRNTLLPPLIIENNLHTLTSLQSLHVNRNHVFMVARYNSIKVLD